MNEKEREAVIKDIRGTKTISELTKVVSELPEESQINIKAWSDILNPKKP